MKDLRPHELFPHDQDHYGGLAATDELARHAEITAGTRVADFCAGLGGTVRYLADKCGSDVTGIDLTPVRAAEAQDLIRRVGLQSKARVIRGNILQVPLADESMDVVLSQEAFCHVPTLEKAISEAFRILSFGGRLAFTDWVANEPLSEADANLMWGGMAIQPLRNIDSYRRLVQRAGFNIVSATDLTEAWRPIVQERLAMYQHLREQARQAGTPEGHDAFHKSYVRFAGLVQQRQLGGVRIVGVKHVVT